MSHLPLGRNCIDNGNFNIWQRGTSFVSPGNVAYLADRYYMGTTTSATITVTQDTSVPNNLSKYSMKAQCTNAYAGTDLVLYIKTAVEGYTFQRILTTPMTLSFWVRASVTGTYCVSLHDYGGSILGWIAEYSIGAADTWTKITIPIPPIPSGSWALDSNGALTVRFWLAKASGYYGTAGAWGDASKFMTSNQTNWAATLNATWYLSQVQLEPGSSATEFEILHPSDDLQRCRRCYQRITPNGATGYIGAGTIFSGTVGVIWIPLPIVMRAVPTFGVSTQTYFELLAGSTAQTTSAIAGFVYTPYSLELLAYSAGTWTIGQGCLLRFGNSGGYLEALADL